VYESIFFHYWVNRVKIEMIEYKKAGSWWLKRLFNVHFPNVILLMNLLYEYLDKLNGGLGEKNLGEAKDWKLKRLHYFSNWCNSKTGLLEINIQCYIHYSNWDT
jgi:hypothetical protein